MCRRERRRYQRHLHIPGGPDHTAAQPAQQPDFRLHQFRALLQLHGALAPLCRGRPCLLQVPVNILLATAFHTRMCRSYPYCILVGGWRFPHTSNIRISISVCFKFKQSTFACCSAPPDVPVSQVVNNDPSAQVHYKLTITPSFSDISLTPSEQSVMSDLWNACAQPFPSHPFLAHTTHCCAVSWSTCVPNLADACRAAHVEDAFAAGAAKLPSPLPTSPTLPPVMVRRCRILGCFCGVRTHS